MSETKPDHVRATIDGKPIEVLKGTTVIRSAEELGIRIPRFCWHPDLTVDGNCRMCQVEVEKMPKLQIACNTQVTEGMVVHTKSPRAAEGLAGPGQVGRASCRERVSRYV